MKEFWRSKGYCFDRKNILEKIKLQFTNIVKDGKDYLTIKVS